MILRIEERNEGTTEQPVHVLYAVLSEPGKTDTRMVITPDQLPFMNALKNLLRLGSTCDHRGAVRATEDGKRYCTECDVLLVDNEGAD